MLDDDNERIRKIQISNADVTLFTGRGQSDAGIYGEAVTSKWGQLFVIDALYAAYAARHFDATLEHLEATYSTAIRHTRT